MQYINYIVCALLVWNLIVFILYGADKRKAKKGKQRISEKNATFYSIFYGRYWRVFRYDNLQTQDEALEVQDICSAIRDT